MLIKSFNDNVSGRRLEAIAKSFKIASRASFGLKVFNAFKIFLRRWVNDVWIKLKSLASSTDSYPDSFFINNVMNAESTLGTGEKHPLFTRMIIDG